MKEMKKLLFVLVAGAALGLTGCDKMPKLGPPSEGRLATASQEDCGFVQNNYGQRVSWKQSLPVKVYVDPSFPESYMPVLKSAGTRWETGLQSRLFTFERATAKSSAEWDGRNVLYWENPWESFERQLEGVTTLSWYRNQIVEADIKINAGNYAYFIEKTDSYNELHLESLLVHELGHFLGLKHLDASSVMLEALDYATKREIPTSIDKSHIRCEYN